MSTIQRRLIPLLLSFFILIGCAAATPFASAAVTTPTIPYLKAFATQNSDRRTAWVEVETSVRWPAAPSTGRSVKFQVNGGGWITMNNYIGDVKVTAAKKQRLRITAKACASYSIFGSKCGTRTTYATVR